MDRFECPKCGHNATIAPQLKDPLIDEESPGNFSIPALGAAAAAAAVGAVAWAALSIYLNYEYEFIAWVIGGLIGYATIKVGGSGQSMGILAAIITVLSIFCGKYAAVEFASLKYIGRGQYEDYLGTISLDIAALESIGEDPTDSQIADWLVTRGYYNETDRKVTPEAIDDFREQSIPFLLSFDPDAQNYDRWRREKEAEHHVWIEAQGGTLQVMIDDLNVMDVVFLLAGVSTAFALVRRG